jgi:putative membrane protein
MWGAGMWGWGVLWMLVFWGALITGVVWLVRTATDRVRPDASTTGRRLLDERFARGEVSIEAYEERRHALEHRA